MDFQEFVANRRERVNGVLKEKLPEIQKEPQLLHSAMHYAVLNGGKRIRPLLIYATGELFDTPKSDLDAPACAIELIHSYSLVHDDLPAMDNDDLRRGLPTCHKAFDEATAILVGDALQSLAFQTLSSADYSQNSETKLFMVRELAQACGSLGLVGGQALDLNATGKQIDLVTLDTIHQLKTGALIRASTRLGLLAAKVKEPQVYDHLEKFSHYIGLCFQIKDDILDVEGNTATLGKQQGADSALDKPTYGTTQTLNAAKEKLLELHHHALASLEDFGDKAYFLRALADYIILRDR